MMYLSVVPNETETSGLYLETWLHSCPRATDRDTDATTRTGSYLLRQLALSRIVTPSGISTIVVSTDDGC